MRIALFSEVYWPMVSGVSLTLQRLVSAMKQRGHVVRVYTGAYPLPSGTAPRTDVHRSPSRPFFLYPDVQWAFPRLGEVRADFAHFHPDLVHVATEFSMGQTGLRLAREFELPVVASAHTDYERYASRYRLDWALRPGWHYLRHFYSQAELVLAPSRVYEEHLHRRGVWHTGVWSRGVAPNPFVDSGARGRVRAAFGLSDDVPLVLSVGRLAAEKNLHLLLEAWRRLRERHPEARLMLVGGGPMLEALQAEAQDGVILAGVHVGDALSEIYAAADCFAFPSSTETFGNVLLEAMAGGLPSLAVEAGGVLDFAEHDRNAWLVAPDSTDALVEGIDRLLTDATLRARLRAGALETAGARRWDEVFDLLERDYRSVVRRPGRAVAA